MLVVFSLVYSLPFVWAALGVLAYMLACLWQWTQLPAMHWAWSVQALRVDVFGQMTLSDKQGRIWSFKLRPDTVVHSACMVLHLADLDREEVDMTTHPVTLTFIARWFQPKRLLILADQGDAQALQSLRVWLKWGLRE